MRGRHLGMPACAAALALALGACGGQSENRSLLPQQASESMREDLDQLEQAVEDGDCERVDEEIASLNEEIANLPQRTSRRLRARLQQGVSDLAARAAEECADNREAETTETEPETTPTETTETEPPETEPAPPAPPETTPPETAPPPTTTPAPPQEGGGEEGGGIPAPDGTVLPPGQAKKQEGGR